MSDGYGWPHQKLRAQWQARIDGGADVHCWRPDCGRPILPGMRWHLGHDDHDRSIYRGPECVRCNLRAAAATTNAKKAGKARRERERRAGLSGSPDW